MDEEVSIINTKTRNEKIKDFLIQNKKGIIVFFSSIVLIVIIFFGFNDYKDKGEYVGSFLFIIFNNFSTVILFVSSEYSKVVKLKLLEICFF